MGLESLMVAFRTYRAKKIRGKMSVRESESGRGGLYKSRNANDVRNILTNGKSLLPVYVRLSNKSMRWIEIKP